MISTDFLGVIVLQGDLYFGYSFVLLLLILVDALLNTLIEGILSKDRLTIDCICLPCSFCYLIKSLTLFSRVE